MDPYLLGLYVHLLALVAAVVASSIAHFNVTRLRAAGTTSEARGALRAVSGAAKLLPAAALALFLSGAYLTSFRWGWQHGWIAASIAGLISMPLIGAIVLKPRFASIATALGHGDDRPIPAAAVTAVHDRAITFAMNCNHATSLLIMLVMVAKPAGMTAAIILLLSPALAALSIRRGRLALRADATSS